MTLHGQAQITSYWNQQFVKLVTNSKIISVYAFFLFPWKISNNVMVKVQKGAQQFKSKKIVIVVFSA